MNRTVTALQTDDPDESSTNARVLPFGNKAANHKSPRKKLGWRGYLALGLVALPTLIVGTYEFFFAANQYVSEIAFVVRPQTPALPVGPSMATAISGGNPMLEVIEDSEVVTRYISSPQILLDLNGQISLSDIYGAPHGDFWSRMSTRRPLERKVKYWGAMVTPYFDLSSGIITVDVRAFTPADAKRVSAAILNASENLVNKMSATARGSALQFAEDDVAKARQTIFDDEAALSAYRNENSVLSPELTAQMATGVTGEITTQLAEDNATLQSLLSQGQTDTSPQVHTLRMKIAAERQQIATLDHSLASNGGGKAETLASVMEKYDILQTNETLDEQLYASDLETLQAARSQADQKQIYLEPFMSPAEPTSSTYPISWLITLEAFVAGGVVWALVVLMTQAVIDRID